jgi:hypothetical protein
VGTWGNASGARLELTADHKASAYGLDHALPLWPGCSPVIGEGGWAFYEPTGDPESYFASDDAAHGQSLWLGAGGSVVPFRTYAPPDADSARGSTGHEIGKAPVLANQTFLFVLSTRRH